MNILLSLILFPLGFIINIFLFYSLCAPLLWLPYVLFKIAVGALKPRAILTCVISPLIWSVALFIAGFLDNVFFNFAVYKFISTSAFTMGGLLALAVGLLTVFGRKASTEFRINLYSIDAKNLYIIPLDIWDIFKVSQMPDELIPENDHFLKASKVHYSKMVGRLDENIIKLLYEKVYNVHLTESKSKDAASCKMIEK